MNEGHCAPLIWMSIGRMIFWVIPRFLRGYTETVYIVFVCLVAVPVQIFAEQAGLIVHISFSC